jgi:hypothetical protein
VKLKSATPRGLMGLALKWRDIRLERIERDVCMECGEPLWREPAVDFGGFMAMCKTPGCRGPGLRGILTNHDGYSGRSGAWHADVVRAQAWAIGRASAWAPLPTRQDQR